MTKRFALLESEDNDLTLRLFKTFKEGADEVIERMKETLSKEEGSRLEGMLNNYRMTESFYDKEGNSEVFINARHNTIEAWNIYGYHYVARLTVIEV